MDPSSEARNIAKEQYTSVRRSLADFEERVIASRWDEDALVRTGFDRFLGLLDRTADWLFPEGEQSEGEQPEGGQPEDESDQPKSESHDEPGQPPESHEEEPEPTADEAEPTADEAEEPDTIAQAEPGEPGTTEEALAVTIGVVFVLPADVEATSVALCGEFNGWAEGDIYLSRDTEGIWRTIVALEPGRSYRYRFLLDGERWENARDADDYVPNPFGTVDSVVIVR
jgi:hypothetical protein